MKLAELKEICRSQSLPVSGRKAGASSLFEGPRLSLALLLDFTF